MRRLWLTLSVLSLVGVVLTAAAWVYTFSDDLLLIQVGWLEVTPLDGNIYFGLTSKPRFTFRTESNDSKFLLAQVIADFEVHRLPCWSLVLLFSGSAVGFWRLNSFSSCSRSAPVGLGVG